MTDQNIGKKLGNYRIDHLIGEGGMSHVYEGRHEKFERRYAIKVLKPELTIQASVRWRFENEAKVMDKLNDCRDIINVHDFYEEGNFLAIIMEFLEGETLKDRIKKGAMTPAVIKELFPRILDAFKYAHDRKIVHRDVKPSNIFLLSNGEIRVLDFGIAKFTDTKEDHTATGAQIGTVIYMSPEQVLDSKHLDYHSDIYSLGVMLYHCLTGTSPYNTETISRFEIQRKIVDESLAELQTIPEPYRSIIARCTAKKPEDRYQNCEEIKQAILAGKTTQVKKVNDDETVLDIAPVFKAQAPQNRRNDETVVDTGNDSIKEGEALAKQKVEEEKERIKKANEIAEKQVAKKERIEKEERLKKENELAKKQAEEEKIKKEKAGLSAAEFERTVQKAEPVKPAAPKKRNKNLIKIIFGVVSLFICCVLIWLIYIYQANKKAEGIAIEIFGIEVNASKTKRFYYNNGKLMYLDLYNNSNNKENEISVDYYFFESGELREETPYTNGNLNGIQKNYFKSGILYSETPWINGSQIGVAKQYSESGALEFETPYTDSKRNGISKEYYESGALQAEAPYIDDKQNGISKTYYENGKIHTESPYFDDKLNGHEKEYSETGKLIKSTYYVNGDEVAPADYVALNAIQSDSTATKEKRNSLPSAITKLISDMIYVQGGTFTMGCTSEQGSDCYDNEKPAHSVTVSSFKIGKYEVTQAQWQMIVEHDPSQMSHCSNCPVDHVSWNDVQGFIIKLNKLTEQKFRLPTEAEWEYAARGGKNSKGYKYSGSNNISSIAWYRANYGGETHVVGTKKANELGMHDMTGNVYEWCSDKYIDYSSSSKQNTHEPGSGEQCVLRGSAWSCDEKESRVTIRNGYFPYNNAISSGFRLAQD